MDNMKELKVWQCRWCKKLFKTPNRHCCKKDPVLKNCFTCKNLMGWDKGEAQDDHYEPPYPDCKAGNDECWDIDSIQEVNYDLQCESWKEGKYSWLEDHKLSEF